MNRPCFFNGQGDGSPVGLNSAVKQIGFSIVQHMAEKGIGFGEKDRFNHAGLIFKTQKFHGISVLGDYDLSGDEPSGKGDGFTDEFWKIPGFDGMVIPEDVPVQNHGVKGA